MNSVEIKALVTGRASRFGERNPQQYQQLVDRLGKADGREVANGLLRVFIDGRPPPGGSAAQEIAGALLMELTPKGDFDLTDMLRQALKRYELSVEQFPQYLAKTYGRSVVLDALSHVESENLTASEQRAVHTMRFWLKA